MVYADISVWKTGKGKGDAAAPGARHEVCATRVVNAEDFWYINKKKKKDKGRKLWEQLCHYPSSLLNVIEVYRVKETAKFVTDYAQAAVSFDLHITYRESLELRTSRTFWILYCKIRSLRGCTSYVQTMQNQVCISIISGTLISLILLFTGRLLIARLSEEKKCLKLSLQPKFDAWRYYGSTMLPFSGFPQWRKIE